jgi:hypothetical protein
MLVFKILVSLGKMEVLQGLVCTFVPHSKFALINWRPSKKRNRKIHSKPLEFVSKTCSGTRVFSVDPKHDQDFIKYQLVLLIMGRRSVQSVQRI